MDARSCTSSPTEHPDGAFEPTHNPASVPSTLEISQSKVSSTIHQSTPSARYLVATNKQQPGLPPSTSQEVATNPVQEAEGAAAACQGMEEDQVDPNQELSKFDEVAASESLLMLSGGGGAGKDISCDTFTFTDITWMI